MDIEKPKDKSSAIAERKPRTSQSDVPSVSLAEALRVAYSISENYALKPTRPIAVAEALDYSPTSSTFRMICGAAIAYGITDGGYNASQIGVTDLGKRIVRPTVEGDEMNARREAFLRPRVIREFLTKYDGSKLPKDKIAKNVLAEMGIPAVDGDRVFNLIVNGAKDLGLVRIIRGEACIDLTANVPVGEPEEYEMAPAEFATEAPVKPSVEGTRICEGRRQEKETNIFIAHGKRTSQLVAQIKQLLEYGKFRGVVSVEKESVSQPVPEKIFQDMRSCGAGILVISNESEEDGNQSINENVLIEVGAARVLYGARFILLVEEGVSLPSNLQGLYEVRYRGTALDGDATLKLLKAVSELKKFPLTEL